MYIGIIILFLCSPVALGSAWGLVPAEFIGILFIIRTAKEDRMLQEELAGYKDYSKRSATGWFQEYGEKGAAACSNQNTPWLSTVKNFPCPRHIENASLFTTLPIGNIDAGGVEVA